MSERTESMEKLYRWYRLGCRIEEQIPMEYEEFAEHYLLQQLNGGLLQCEVFNRTSAEWELDREDAAWTNILNRLRNMNFAPEGVDLVATIHRGYFADHGENGDSGAAGVPAYRLPDLPILSGAAAHSMPLPDWEFELCAFDLPYNLRAQSHDGSFLREIGVVPALVE